MNLNLLLELASPSLVAATSPAAPHGAFFTLSHCAVWTFLRLTSNIATSTLPVTALQSACPLSTIITTVGTRSDENPGTDAILGFGTASHVQDDTEDRINTFADPRLDAARSWMVAAGGRRPTKQESSCRFLLMPPPPLSAWPRRDWNLKVWFEELRATHSLRHVEGVSCDRVHCCVQ